MIYLALFLITLIGGIQLVNALVRIGGRRDERRLSEEVEKYFNGGER